MNISPGRYDQNERGYCQFTSFLSTLNQALIKKLKTEYDINCNYQISMNDLLKCLKDKLLLNPSQYTKNCNLWSITKAERIGSGTVICNGRPSPYKDYRNIEKIHEFYVCDGDPQLSSILYSDILAAVTAEENFAYEILAKTLIENSGGGNPSGSASNTIIWDGSAVTVSGMGTAIQLPDNFPYSNDSYINYASDFLRKSVLIIKKEKTEEIPVVSTVSNDDISLIEDLFSANNNYFLTDPTIANILIDTILSSDIEINLIEIEDGETEILDQENFSPTESEENISGGFCCVNDIATNVYSGKQDCINAGGVWIDGYYDFDINEPGVCSKPKPELCSYDPNCNYIKFRCSRKEVNLLGLGSDPFVRDEGLTNEDYINYIQDILNNNSSIELSVNGWLINLLTATNNPNINIINDEWFIDYENIISAIPENQRLPSSFSAHAVTLMRIEANENNYIFYIKNSWAPPLDTITITINKKYLDINNANNKDIADREKIFQSIFPMNFPIGEYASYIDFSSLQILNKADIVCSECASTSSSSSS